MTGQPSGRHPSHRLCLHLAVQTPEPFRKFLTPYRYTPLLAYLMLPNITLHIGFGKVLFAAADIAVAILIRKIVTQKCTENKIATSKTYRIIHVALAAWLFNPYTATISTRGSGDSLVVLMQLGVLILLQTQCDKPRVHDSRSSTVTGTSAPGVGRLATAGAIYGLLVHWRVFPVIYGPSLILFLWTQSHGVRCTRSHRHHPALAPHACIRQRCQNHTLMWTQALLHRLVDQGSHMSE